MKIAIFGAGGIGGYFGARLAAGGADVHLIARGSHLTALQSDGLRIRSSLGSLELPLPATSDPATIGPCDVVLFCVKSTDTFQAASRLGPLLKSETAVISLQNGVDNEATVANVIGEPHVVGGVAYILATIAEPGIIQHQGELARIVFGESNGGRSPRLEAFLALCEKSGIDAELSTDIAVELWRKMALICGIAGMTAATRAPLGAIRDSKPAWRMLRRILEEVVAVARAEAVGLEDETVQKIMATAQKLPAEFTSSLHYDLTHSKPMELEALHGAIVERAEGLGVHVPMCEAVYAVLHPWAAKYGDAAGSRA